MSGTPFRFPRLNTRPMGLLSLLLSGLVLAGPWAASSALAADTAVLKAEVITQSDSQTEVIIRLGAAAGTPEGGGAPAYSAFRATNPDRLIIDISDAKLADVASVMTGGLVSRAEFTSFNDGKDNVRLTLALARSCQFEHQAVGNDIRIVLTPKADANPSDLRLSGPLSDVTGPAITSLDFQQKETSSRIIIGYQESEPAVSQPSATLIAVDLPGARIPDSLRRNLDTRFFASAVDTVVASTTRSGVRVNINLRAGAEYTVSRENGLYILEIPTPPEIIAQRQRAIQQSASAAPSSPSGQDSGRLGNATGSEVLIGGDGRTADPNSVFGRGSGSRSAQTYAFVIDSPGVSVPKFSGRRMSIDLQDADIHTVFRFIAEFADINIVTSDDVKGNITVRLENVPWDEALAAVMQSKGLGAQQYGSVIRVAPLERIKAEQKEALDAQTYQKQLTELSVYVAPINYVSASDLVKQIETVLSERGSVEVDQRGNQLIIKDLEENIAKARELIRQIDKMSQQVVIDARFVEAASSFSRSLGIQWGTAYDASVVTGFPTGLNWPNSVGLAGDTEGDFSSALGDNLLFDLGSQGGTNTALTLNLGSITGLFDLDARLSAAESEGWGKVVSSPRVSVIDNETATIEQGARIPYESTSNNGTQIQFVDAMLKLEVTPHITAEGDILLDVVVSNDRPDFSQTVNGRPTIQKKEVTTQLLVADGDTVTLGGVYSTSETASSEFVPFLGRIPLIGYLFRNSLKTSTQNEMLVFITPRIVVVEGE